MTVAPRPSKRAAESFGAIVAMTSWTWRITAAKSISGSPQAMPKRAAPRQVAAVLAAASSALDGTQP
jgi:hypothetical protein